MFRLFFLRRELKKSRRQKQVVGFDEAKTLVILYEVLPDGRHDFLTGFIRDMEDEGKTVVALGFDYMKKGAEVQLTGPGLILTKSDFSWTLKPKNARVKELLQGEKHDLLLDLTGSNAIRMKCLAVLLPASYKAGPIHPDFQNIYDLILEVNQDCFPEDLARHVIYYLKIIKTISRDDKKA